MKKMRLENLTIIAGPAYQYTSRFGTRSYKVWLEDEYGRIYSGTTARDADAGHEIYHIGIYAIVPNVNIEYHMTRNGNMIIDKVEEA